MRHPPDKRKPAEVESAGFQMIDELAGKIDTSKNSLNTRLLQAHRIRQRFAVSTNLALTIADLAFAAGRVG